MNNPQELQIVQAKSIAHLDRLPDSAMVRTGQLITRRGVPGLLPISNSALWRHVADGSFPKPVKLFRNVTAWKLGDVRAWLAQREAAK